MSHNFYSTAAVCNKRSDKCSDKNWGRVGGKLSLERLFRDSASDYLQYFVTNEEEKYDNPIVYE